MLLQPELDEKRRLDRRRRKSRGILSRQMRSCICVGFASIQRPEIPLDFAEPESMLDTLQGALGASRNRRTSVSKPERPQAETSYLLSSLHFDDNDLRCILCTLRSFSPAKLPMSNA